MLCGACCAYETQPDAQVAANSKVTDEELQKIRTMIAADQARSAEKATLPNARASAVNFKKEEPRSRVGRKHSIGDSPYHTLRKSEAERIRFKLAQQTQNMLKTASKRISASFLRSSRQSRSSRNSRDSRNSGDSTSRTSTGPVP